MGKRRKTVQGSKHTAGSTTRKARTTSLRKGNQAGKEANEGGKGLVQEHESSGASNTTKDKRAPTRRSSRLAGQSK